MELKKGNIKVILNDKKLAWQAYFGDVLIAHLDKDEWQLPEPNFISQEAGQLLLNQYSEVFAALNSVSSEEVQASMVKDDQGDVGNLPTNATEFDALEELSDEQEPSEARIIIIKLQELLIEASKLRAQGQEYSNIFDEINTWAARYANLEDISRQNIINDLFIKAEYELLNDINCEATLDEIEDRLRVE